MIHEIDSPFADGTAFLESEVADLTFRGDTYTVRRFYYRCKATGETFTTLEADELNLLQVHNQYRERHGILYPEEIEAIRKGYGLSAAKMSAVLGLGVNSWRLYEQGEIPSLSNSRLILAARDSRDFLRFLEAAKNELTDKEYAKVKKQIEQKMQAEMQRAFASDHWIPELIFVTHRPNACNGFVTPDLEKVAELIGLLLRKLDGTVRTKLNKLLYYIDSYHFRETGRSVSGLSYRAIQWGPVPANYDFLYGHLKNRGVIEEVEGQDMKGNLYTLYRGVQTEGEPRHLSPDELESVEFILHALGETGSRKLSQISHAETGWLANEAQKGLISFQEYAFDLKAV